MDGDVFVFPGQGAQYQKMGISFYEHYPEARAVFEEASDVLSTSLTKLVFKSSHEELMLTKNSQISIFVVCSAILNVLRKEFPQLSPSMCGGLSLGEYTALMASGRVSFVNALRLVAARAQHMHDASLELSGKMAAVIGMSENEILNCGYSIAAMPLSISGSASMMTGRVKSADHTKRFFKSIISFSRASFSLSIGSTDDPIELVCLSVSSSRAIP